jgi:hypothetical protein
MLPLVVYHKTFSLSSPCPSRSLRLPSPSPIVPWDHAGIFSTPTSSSVASPFRASPTKCCAMPPRGISFSSFLPGCPVRHHSPGGLFGQHRPGLCQRGRYHGRTAPPHKTDPSRHVSARGDGVVKRGIVGHRAVALVGPGQDVLGRLGETLTLSSKIECRPSPAGQDRDREEGMMPR